MRRGGRGDNKSSAGPLGCFEEGNGGKQVPGGHHVRGEGERTGEKRRICSVKFGTNAKGTTGRGKTSRTKRT